MSGVNPVFVLFFSLVYLLASTGVLIGFAGVLNLIGRAGAHVRSIKQLQPLEPVIVSLVDYLTRVFGPLHKFTPQATHVMLVAVLVALVANGQRRR